MKNINPNRYKKLIIHKPVIIKGDILRTYPNVRKNRQYLRDQHAQFNKDIMNDKPYELAWNASLLMPKYDIPVHSYYSTAVTAESHIQRNLIRAKQNFDPLCYNIINYIDTGNRALLQDLPGYIIRYVASGRYDIDSRGILVFKHEFKKRTETHTDNEQPTAFKDRPLTVLPSALINTVLKFAHGKCHNGTDKMLQIIKENLHYWWPKMKKHINAHTTCCQSCQFIKHGKYKTWKNTNRMKLFSATKPFQQISVDIVGPLPVSHSQNRYIVSIIDKFTRYCMLIPVKDVKSLTIVQAIDRWMTTFGPPESILSDNGPQFISAIYKDYNDNIKDGGTKRKYTSTYYAQCNGQIERLHRWLKERLALIAFDGRLNFVDGDDDWSDYLPIIQYTYNSTPNKMTSYAPMNIVFGNDLYEIPKEFNFDPALPEQYIQYLSNRQAIIRFKANKQQAKYDEARKRYFDKKNSDKRLQYQIGDRVLYDIHTHFTGNRAKLGPKWVGPFEIIHMLPGEQAIKLRIIPLPDTDNAKNNPMNAFTIPRRGNMELSQDEFIVNRSQIKPYFEAYEQQYDGIQSPAQLAMTKLHDQLNEISAENQHILLCHQQLTPLNIPLQSLIKSATDIRNKLKTFGADYKLQLDACSHAIYCGMHCCNVQNQCQLNMNTLSIVHTLNNELY